MWISVDDIKEVPEGKWEFYLEEEVGGLSIHTGRVTKNVSIVGGLFSFDMPKVKAYKPLPEPPDAQ